MLREKAQSVTTARPKVPMRRLGAHCLVVAMKRGNARGAKGVGHQRWIGSTGVGSTGSGRNLIINGRRQPSHGGTSRMMREYHVRICEGLGCNSPGLLGNRPLASESLDGPRGRKRRAESRHCRKLSTGPFIAKPAHAAPIGSFPSGLFKAPLRHFWRHLRHFWCQQLIRWE